MYKKLNFYDFESLQKFLRAGHSGTHLVFIEDDSVVIQYELEDKQPSNHLVSVAGAMRRSPLCYIY